MSDDNNDLIEKIRALVNRHYGVTSSPLLLSELGGQLSKDGLWPLPLGKGQSLRNLIDSRGQNSGLVIVRDKTTPAYVAVAPIEKREIVEQWIHRRNHTTNVIPDLAQLPRSVLLAFCVQTKPSESVFVRIEPPFRYQIGSPEEGEQFVIVDERYRRPGLKISDLDELTASDRLDLQTRIASWSKDTNVPIETFYRTAKRPMSALERLLAAQPAGVAEKIVIPGDIALLLTRRENE